MADIVIGSGPAGVAAAAARLAKGREVVLLDGGRVLEPERRALRDRVAAGETAARDALAEAQAATPAGQVRRFGSDFAMEAAEGTFAYPNGVAVRASRAVGGLSNLWGTAVLPFAAADLSGWPITAADLEPHYRAVRELMPVAGRADALAGLFPGGLSDAPVHVPPTAQAAALLSRLERRAERLGRLGITVGQARQAVAAGCRECGLCLCGCPWSLMWSAAHALPRLIGAGLIHRPGATVLSVTQDDNGVSCHLADGGTVTGDRAFLAAGVLETARIALRSGIAAELRLREARHAFVPGLLTRANRQRPDTGPLTTLPQIFVELSDPGISSHLVHAQLYGWNEQYLPDLVASYGRRIPFSAPLWPRLARRLVVAQTFVHSDHWPDIALTLAPDGRLVARTGTGGDAAAVLGAASKRLARGLALGGLQLLTFARREAAPGGSFHLGASLPMAAEPDAGQSDRLGRPAGAGRVHVVDASVLTAVPATTITYPMMANAHRIATETPI